ncbi:hypothetical protein Tco_0146917, partial [Tanacetum coccineum]
MTTPASYTTLLDRFYERGSLGSGSLRLILLIKEQCFDHIFEFGDIGRDSGEISEVEVLALTLATTGLLRELRTLDLLSMIFRHSRG